MTPLELLSENADRFAQQWSAGEWAGPGVRSWLTQQWPCGKLLCSLCGTYGTGRRGVVWSQLMAGAE